MGDGALEIAIGALGGIALSGIAMLEWGPVVTRRERWLDRGFGWRYRIGRMLEHKPFTCRLCMMYWCSAAILALLSPLSFVGPLVGCGSWAFRQVGLVMHTIGASEAATAVRIVGGVLWLFVGIAASILALAVGLACSLIQVAAKAFAAGTLGAIIVSWWIDLRGRNAVIHHTILDDLSGYDRSAEESNPGGDDEAPAGEEVPPAAEATGS